MDVGLALIVCFLMASMTAVQSQIRRGPVNALKRAGDSVTLECVTSSNNCYQVDWQKFEGLQSPKPVYRNGIGMLNSDVYPHRRYSVNENDGCSLTISQLVIGDSGRFSCKEALTDGEYSRSSILVVISVTCMNVTNFALAKDDAYSLECAINIPPKSVEPSDVTLIFQNKTANENTETTNGTQPHTVKTMLTGVATKANITRGCRASFPPKKEVNYDDTVAFLDVCPMHLIVSYPVEPMTVSPSAPYYKGDTVRCTTDGHPPPEIKWTNLKSGDEYGDTLVIKGDAGDEYTCTGTNTVKGRVASQSVAIEVSSTPPPSGCSSGCVAAIVICVFGVTIIVAMVVYFAGWRCGFWVISPCCLPLVNCWNNCICCVICICAIKDKDGEEEPFFRKRCLNSTPSGPTKPPRANENPNLKRPGSECKYAALQPEPNPHQMKSDPVNNSSTIYAAVAIA